MLRQVCVMVGFMFIGTSALQANVVDVDREEVKTELRFALDDLPRFELLLEQVRDVLNVEADADVAFQIETYRKNALEMRFFYVNDEDGDFLFTASQPLGQSLVIIADRVDALLQNRLIYCRTEGADLVIEVGPVLL